MPLSLIVPALPRPREELQPCRAVPGLRLPAPARAGQEGPGADPCLPLLSSEAMPMPVGRAAFSAAGFPPLSPQLCIPGCPRRGEGSQQPCPAPRAARLLPPSCVSVGPNTLGTGWQTGSRVTSAPAGPAPTSGGRFHHHRGRSSRELRLANRICVLETGSPRDAPGVAALGWHGDGPAG